MTATVAVKSPGSGTATGSVTFMDGSKTLGTVALDSSGVATLAVSFTNLGSHSITASYTGDTNYLASSAALTQTVNQAKSHVAPTSSPSPSVYGQAVTFTAIVTATAPGTGTPTGVVTFYDGGTSLGTGTLGTNGVATFTTSSLLAVGNHRITAVYAGDTDFLTSTSTAVTQAVSKAGTTLTIASSANLCPWEAPLPTP